MPPAPPGTGAPDQGYDWSQLVTGIGDWGKKHQGALTKGSMALGGLGVLAGAAGSLDQPEESRLSNAVGAGGNLAGGLAGLATAGAIGARLHPAGRMAGLVLLPLLGSGMGESIARAGASLFEDPQAKALRAAEKEMDLKIRMEEMAAERLLPIRLKEAQIEQALEERKLRNAAAVESQLGLQRAMAQGILQRDQNQTAQDIAMTNAVMQGIFS